MHFLNVKTACVWVLVCLLQGLGASLVIAQSTIEKDIIYSGSSIEYTQKSTAKTHQIVLSSLQRINNRAVIDRDVRVSGEKTVFLIQLNAGSSIEDAVKFYQTLLAKHGRIEFQCEKRGCGISSYWATDIFDERRVLSRDSDQYYLAGKLNYAGKRYWLSAYLVTNALRQNIIHLTLVAELPGQDKYFVENEVNGYLLNDEKTIPDHLLKQIQDKLTAEPELALYIAGFSAKSEGGQRSLSAIQQQLNQDFTALQSKLLSVLGVAEERIVFQFVGPFHVDIELDKPLWFRFYLARP